VYMCYLKEDKGHLDNTVREEENGQYGCMYAWNKIGLVMYAHLRIALRLACPA
jgi:hypothetical protein